MVDETRTKAHAIGSSVAEGVIGLGAVTLAIIAMAGVIPGFLLSIGIIAAGTALLFEAGTASERSGFHGVQMGGTLVQLILGVAVIALGVLGLIGVAPRALIPIAVILLGVGLVLTSILHARFSESDFRRAGFTAHDLNTHETQAKTGRETAHPQMARDFGIMTVSIQAFIGVGVLTLGILALIGVQPIMVLCLVALMATGIALFFNSAALSAMLGWR